MQNKSIPPPPMESKRTDCQARRAFFLVYTGGSPAYSAENAFMPPGRNPARFYASRRFPLILYHSCAFCNTFFGCLQSGKSHYELFSRKNQVFFCRSHLPFLRNSPLFTLILPHYPKITALDCLRFSRLGVHYNFLSISYPFLWKRSIGCQFLEW